MSKICPECKYPNPDNYTECFKCHINMDEVRVQRQEAARAERESRRVQAEQTRVTQRMQTEQAQVTQRIQSDNVNINPPPLIQNHDINTMVQSNNNSSELRDYTIKTANSVKIWGEVVFWIGLLAGIICIVFFAMHQTSNVATIVFLTGTALIVNGCITRLACNCVYCHLNNQQIQINTQQEISEKLNRQENQE